MTPERDRPSLSQLRRELDLARAALAEPGTGTVATLECRVSDLQQRFLVTPCRDLADLAARLAHIRDLVAGLGPGYLLDLVTATLADVEALRRDPGTR